MAGGCQSPLRGEKMFQGFGGGRPCIHFFEGKQFEPGKRGHEGKNEEKMEDRISAAVLKKPARRKRLHDLIGPFPLQIHLYEKGGFPKTQDNGTKKGKVVGQALRWGKWRMSPRPRRGWVRKGDKGRGGGGVFFQLTQC